MLVSETITVNNSTATLLVDGATMGEYVVHIRAAQDVVIGDSGVSPASGMLLNGAIDNTDIFTLRLQGESLYGVALNGTTAIGILAYSA